MFAHHPESGAVAAISEGLNVVDVHAGHRF